MTISVVAQTPVPVDSIAEEVVANVLAADSLQDPLLFAVPVEVEYIPAEETPELVRDRLALRTDLLWTDTNTFRNPSSEKKRGVYLTSTWNPFEREGKTQVIVPVYRSSYMGAMTLRSEADIAALKAKVQ